MSNMARRLVALEKKAPQGALPHEERLVRLRRKGRASPQNAGHTLSARDLEQLVAKVNALRERPASA
ncbi:hypothetical protein [Sneathiella sp.]|uniref:hypothetical protein n=1 Tax=Sneathiella sp. TaxID=1964365 RepID=UPI00356A7E68